MLVIAFALILRFIDDDSERAGYSCGLLVFGVLAFLTIMIASPAGEDEVEQQRQYGLIQIQTIKSGLVNCAYVSGDGYSKTMITTRDHCSYLYELYGVISGKIESINQYRENKTGGQNELVTKHNK